MIDIPRVAEEINRRRRSASCCPNKGYKSYLVRDHRTSWRLLKSLIPEVAIWVSNRSGWRRTSRTEGGIAVVYGENTIYGSYSVSARNRPARWQAAFLKQRPKPYPMRRFEKDWVEEGTQRSCWRSWCPPDQAISSSYNLNKRRASMIFERKCQMSATISKRWCASIARQRLRLFQKRPTHQVLSKSVSSY